MNMVIGLDIFQGIYYPAKRLKNALAKEIGFANKKSPCYGAKFTFPLVLLHHF
jgi:hypothetical protein